MELNQQIETAFILLGIFGALIFLPSKEALFQRARAWKKRQ